MIRTGKRILMLTHQCAGRGGSFMRAVSLARPLANMGYQMTLIASRSDTGLRLRASDWHGVRVLEMPDVLPQRIRNGGLSPLDVVERLLHTRSGIDLFHAFDHRPGASLPALWRRDRSIPFVSDWADLWGEGGLSLYRSGFRAWLVARLDAWLEPHVRRHCTAVTAISKELSRRAVAFGVPEERVRRVPVGANADLIVPMDRAEARRHYGIPEDAEVLACSGFSSLDMQLMLQSFLELRKMRPQVKLLMTGAELPAFAEAARLAGAERSILHLGMQPYEKLGEALACGDVMWLPYGAAPVNAARFPNRLGEYMAAGRPIATNPGGDHAVVVEREGIGITTPAEPRATALGVAALLDDRHRADEMGRRARQLAEGPYSWSSIACTVAGLYEELLGN